MGNESKFTPGPWVWVGGQLLAKRDGHTDCVMVAADAPYDPSSEDARLIAAAPELLEHVQLLERCLLYEIKVAERKGDDEGALLKSLTLHLVRETLAKASSTPIAEER